jgi:hypothetical protein
LSGQKFQGTCSNMSLFLGTCCSQVRIANGWCKCFLVQFHLVKIENHIFMRLSRFSPFAGVRFFNSQPNPFQSSPYQIFAFFPTNPLTLRMQSVWKFMILAKTSFAVCCYIWTKTAHSHLEANAHKKNKFTPKATQHTTPIAKRRVSFLWRQFGIDRRASLVKKNRSLNNVGHWLVWGAPPLKVI